MKRPGGQFCAWHSYLAGVKSLITRRRDPQSSLECHRFVLKKYLDSEASPKSEGDVKLCSLSSRVELREASGSFLIWWNSQSGGSPGPYNRTPSWLEIRGCTGPLMGLTDSLERRFVFLGGMDDFTLVDEVA